MINGRLCRIQIPNNDSMSFLRGNVKYFFINFIFEEPSVPLGLYLGSNTRKVLS